MTDRPIVVFDRSVPQYPYRDRNPVMFAVVLERSRGKRRITDNFRGKTLETLISECPVRAKTKIFPSSGFISAKLFFDAWRDALDTAAYFWRRKLESDHEMNVRIVSSSTFDACDRAQEDAMLRDIFSGHIRGLLASPLVTDYDKKFLEGASLPRKARNKKGVSLDLFEERQAVLKRLGEERNLYKLKQAELRDGLLSILRLLGSGKEDKIGVESDEVEIFFNHGKVDWSQVCCLLMREIRRFDEGLPIYAYRSRIINAINSNQVLILVGETGSGKSTQIVQYLADMWLNSPGTIICTQPRKIAAASLAKRVCDESQWSYLNDLATSYVSISNVHAFTSRVIFTTDHCLLQLLISNSDLSGVTHIIIDEAHERSLNTDLVLALAKSLLLQRYDLRLIVMSATADTKRLSDYFFGCRTFFVTGRSFPVEIHYVRKALSDAIVSPGFHPKQADYVNETVEMVRTIHQKEGDGAILAFLTSQMEVEWACEKFSSPSAVVLPLHGKLSQEEQTRVFQDFPGKRKVIFSTNIAETSLTIPGVTYVVDPGLVKESRFDPNSGMNVLSVCRISQSSAQQRAGRAGRTEPGKCYRLYSESEFKSMNLHQEPEIRKVHLGIAILRIISIGVKRVKDFDFVDSPDPKSVESAIQNLVYLGAVIRKEGDEEWLELTETGKCLTKLGVEPRLGKMILECHSAGLTKEGLVLAAVMANAGSIFCRVGSNEEKLRADCLKVPFCHEDGDLFTYLSVYLEWEEAEEKNKWCWNNSINAKSMRRCHETVEELDNCLYNDLNIVVPSYWKWQNQQTLLEYRKLLKKVILCSLVDNVAVFSGSDQVGYRVAVSGQLLPLHPSCSLHVFEKKPDWVVFGEILSTSRQFLVCVTAIDFDSLNSLNPPPPFEPSQLAGKTLKKCAIVGVSLAVLRRLCGRGYGKLRSLCARIQNACGDDRIRINVDFDLRSIELLMASEDDGKVNSMVNDALDCQSRYLRNECMEKSLFRLRIRANSPPPTALLGAGGEIKHLELKGRPLSVEIYHPQAKSIDELDILMTIDRHVSGVAAIQRSMDDMVKWGKITFLSPDDVETIVSEMDGMEMQGFPLKLTKSSFFSALHESPPSITAKLFWPRRPCRGTALVRCPISEVEHLVEDLSVLSFGERMIFAEVGMKAGDCVFLRGLDQDTSEEEVLDLISKATPRKVSSVRLLRGKTAVEFPMKSYEDQILLEINPFISKDKVQVQVMEPENPDQSLMKAFLKFDGSLQVEAERALAHLSGKHLAICQPWQKIRCLQILRSSLVCPFHIFPVIRTQLLALIRRLDSLPGVNVSLEESKSGFHRVKMSANGIKRITDVRRPLEELLAGKTVAHPDLTTMAAQLISSCDGVAAARSIERETGTIILHDRRTGLIKIFGANETTATAEEKLVNALLSLYEQSQLQLSLRGNDLPSDLVKQLIERFGPDMAWLEELIPGAKFTLDARRHMLHIRGRKEHRRKAEQIIFSRPIDGPTCAICLCEVEDPYELEDCGHRFCRSCLIEQFESAIRSREGFPLTCVAKEGKCKTPILLVDFRSLLPSSKLDDLFLASLACHVVSSGGAYRFCPSPDCPGVYRVAEEGEDARYSCASCTADTCRKCHLEYHPWMSCEKYKEFKDNPDISLDEYKMANTAIVKNCPDCGVLIEKWDGCEHVTCKCGRHICWICLRTFRTGDVCYEHIKYAHNIF